MIVTTHEIEVMTADVGLVVMDAIMYDTLKKEGNIKEANAHYKAMMDRVFAMSDDDVNAAIYHYQKSLGKEA
jgi:hypothetical protein